MTKHFTVAEFLKDPKKVQTGLRDRPTLRVEHQVLIKQLLENKALHISPRVMKEAFACGAALSAGKAYRIDRATIEMLMEEDAENNGSVIAFVEPVSTSVVLGVLAVALVVGFAVGYIGSDLADDNKGGATDVTHEGDGDIVINNGGNDD